MKNVTVISTFLAIAVLSLGSAAVADSPTTKATVIGGQLAEGEFGGRQMSTSAVDNARGRQMSTSAPKVITGLTSMPLAFTENQGQWDEQVLFRANAGGATMWFTKDGAYYQFSRRIPTTDDASVIASDQRERGNLPHSPNVTLSGVEGRPDQPARGRQMSTSAPFTDHEPDSIETIMIKADFVGANPNPRMVSEEMLEYKCNYFLGNDPSKWRTDVPNYSAIVYEDIYPSIDLKYYGNGKQMEYDFIVSPGADPSQIVVQYEGARSVSVNSAGQLVVETDWGEVVEQRPVVYQMSGSDRVSLASEYVLKGDNSFGFELPDGYNTNLLLVIDPTLVYSTYLGGNYDDYGYAIAVDASGAAYVTGRTGSSNFPTLNPYQTDQGGNDVFVTKLSSSGSSLLYSTYLGGSSPDEGFGIAVDASGAAYVMGYTSSSNFPTLNPYQGTFQGGSFDVFVTKLSSAGNSLVYSTYLGGSSSELGYAIAVDAAGAAYVTGWTESSNFPTLNPYQTDQGVTDAFVTKLSSGGSSLVYSTYLGGSMHDQGLAIAVDAAGAAYVTGNTQSNDFPMLNPYQGTYQGGHYDAFVTKLSSGGSSLVYSTYLGGSSYDFGRGIAVDAAGAAYVTGETLSSDFPMLSPYQTYQGSYDVFVTKLSSSGSSLVYSTYLGGSSSEEGLGIAVDASGAAYVTGYTGSTDFPTLNPYQGTFQGGSSDVFVTKLSSSGSSLLYSTYLGGSGTDYGWGIAIDAAGAAYVTGQTGSSDFPTINPYQTDQGGNDVFVTKFSPDTCCNHDGIRGDVNYDISGLNVADLTYLVDYLFRGGPPPPCPEEGDVNGDGNTNVADLTYLVDYLFRGGPPPLPCP